MSKVGPAQLRKALFFPARVALRYNPVMVELKQRLTAAGKPKMVINGAAMRKLIHMIFGVLKNRTAFDANLSREPLINVCEAVSAAKVAALGEAKISEPKLSEDGTRRVSSFSCVQKAQFIGHK